MDNNEKSVLRTEDAYISSYNDVSNSDIIDEKNNLSNKKLTGEASELPPTLPPGYSKNGDRLYFNNKYISDYLKVLAMTRDKNQNQWGYLVQFKDPDGNLKKVKLYNSELCNDQANVLKELTSQGFRFSPKFKQKLIDYIQESNPTKRARIVENTGWFIPKEVFILPSKTLGNISENIISNIEGDSEDFEISGTLEDWKENIGKYAVGNERLILAISLALSGPLQAILGLENGGIHITGKSSTGKSTIARVACSVWGRPSFLKSWRTTQNGLESIAVSRNDTLLVMDELGQIDSTTAPKVNYILGNGTGKIRSQVTGGLRKTSSWRLQTLSTGEKNFKDIAEETNTRYHAGEDVRMISIPAVGYGYEYGCFRNLHEFKDGNELATHLNEMVQKYYGTPSLIFIESLTKASNDEIKREYEALYTHLSEALIGADGQVKRVAKRLAMIGCAGILAIKFGILNLEPESVAKAIENLLVEWVEDRGGEQSFEETALLKQVKLFIEENGSSQFPRVSDTINQTFDFIRNKMAGFTKEIAGEDFYCAFPEVFGTRICKGFNRNFAINTLIKHGWLKDPPTEQHKVCKKNTKVYMLTSKILES